MKRVSALSPQQRFANSPPLFVHTEPSSSGVKPYQCVNSHSKSALLIQKRRAGTRHDVDVCVFLSTNFHQRPPVNLNM